MPHKWTVLKSIAVSVELMPQIKKPRTMARLGVLIGLTQKWQHTLNIMLICSLESKNVINFFCYFFHTIATDESILQWLIQAIKRGIKDILHLTADG